LSQLAAREILFVASLKTFDKIEKVWGVEIYKTIYLGNQVQYPSIFLLIILISRKPAITILHFNVFDFDFQTNYNNIICR